MCLTERELFYRHMGLPSRAPLGLEIVDAEGIYLFDRKGKKYIDLVSGVSVSNLGHKHPAVIQAVTEQAQKYMHLMVYGQYIQSPQVKLVAKLSENLPESLDSTYFVNSGSEAIEGALKLAKRATGRPGIIAFKNAYHGSTHGALSILGDEKLKNSFRPLLPGVTLLNFNDFDDLEKITKDTACVVLETIQAEAGIILPEEGFLTAIRKKCDETGTLLIIDDIQMGFGRTGKLFSFEHFGITPDILALAKAMGGGMPIGAFIASREIMKSLTFSPELGHITTFGGHPVSAAAALASLDTLLKEDLIRTATDKGALFYSLLSSHPKIREIRHKGLMLGVDIGSDKQLTTLLDDFLAKGLIVDRFLFNQTTFRIAPPLVITTEEIHRVCDLITECLNDVDS